MDVALGRRQSPAVPHRVARRYDHLAAARRRASVVAMGGVRAALPRAASCRTRTHPSAAECVSTHARRAIPRAIVAGSSLRCFHALGEGGLGSKTRNSTCCWLHDAAESVEGDVSSCAPLARSRTPQDSL